MSLFLVRHGNNLPKDKDPDKGLSEQGIAEVKRIAEVAKGYCVRVGLINHSGKKRARRTAELFASALKPRGGVNAVDGLNPLDDVTLFAQKIDSNENLMLVGHLPFMEKLTSFLVTGSIETRVFQFQTGGIVCLDKDTDNRSWIIKWALMPNIG